MSKLHGNRIEVGQISASARNSLSAVNGHLVYNTDTNLLQYYNPSGWQSLGDASPSTKSDYPTPTGSTTVFTTIWTGSPSNLPTSDGNSTWQAPASTTKARVVVIGGGLIGCSIVYHLAKLGCRDVILLERDELTSGSTWHAAAGIHGLHDNNNITRIQHYTMQLYK